MAKDSQTNDLHKKWENMYEESFTPNTKQQSNPSQIIDITNNYSWTNDSIIKKGKANTDIPYCYAVEYRQQYSTSITNFVNSINAFKNSGLSFENANKNLFNNNSETIVDKLADGLSALSLGYVTKNEAEKFVNKGVTGLTDIINNVTKEGVITNGIDNKSTYLSPYKLLYALAPTNKKYNFPMLSQSAMSFNLSNTFAQDSAAPLGKIIGTLSNGAQYLAKMGVQLQNISSFVGAKEGSTGTLFQATEIQKAKHFQFPSGTDSYQISFPLFNTVKGNGREIPWKKNYKFIFLFTLRNLLFRKNNVSFFPPAFYDLIIPGIVRQPFTYISSFTAKPVGMIRNMKVQNIFSRKLLDGNESYVAPIPQAWIVTIKFTSLIATSANLILSGLNDINIVTS